MILLDDSHQTSIIKTFYDYQIQKIVIIMFQAMLTLFNFDLLTHLLFTIIMNQFFATRHIFLTSKTMKNQCHGGSIFLSVIIQFTLSQKILLYRISVN